MPVHLPHQLYSSYTTANSTHTTPAPYSDCTAAAAVNPKQRRRRLTLNSNCRHRRVTMCLCIRVRACDSNATCTVHPACKCTSIPYPPMFQQCIPTATAVLYDRTVRVPCCTLYNSNTPPLSHAPNTHLLPMPFGQYAA